MNRRQRPSCRAFVTRTRKTITPSRIGICWKTISRGRRTYRRDSASSFGCGDWGRLIGLWHDLGKFSDAFQNYLRAAGLKGGAHSGEIFRPASITRRPERSGSRVWECSGCRSPIASRGHHAGLPDNIGGESGLSARLLKKVEPLVGVPDRLMKEGLPKSFELTCEKSKNSTRAGFTLAFFTRMLFSCLVDADFLDTEAFVAPERGGLRRKGGSSCSELLIRLNKHLEEKQKQADVTNVNRVRREVLEACRSGAELPPGIFSLNVPTGGGKTLSSLAFAPGPRGETRSSPRRVRDPVHQHHRTNRPTFFEKRSETTRSLSITATSPRTTRPRQTERSRLASENFDSSLIVTTNVQLFESLFASRTSRCRKLHRLANSVIILDEAQTLPIPLLASTLAALEELVNNYGTTVVPLHRDAACDRTPRKLFDRPQKRPPP